MSLFGRFAKFFRADAAQVAPAQAPAAPPRRSTRHDMRHLSMGGAASGFSNASSGYGMPGFDPRLNSQFQTGYMTDELAAEMWRGSALTEKIVSLLPSEAIEPGWDITIQDDDTSAGGAPDPRDSAELVESVETRHRALGTDRIIKRANEWDRLFGGAAIWLGANDMLAEDWSQPLNLDAPNLRLNWLRVLRSRDLYPLYYYTDPMHPKHGEVAVWQLQSRTRGTVMMPAVRIHESRLHLFRGRRIVEDGTMLSQNPNSSEFGNGILLGIYGAIRRFEEALDNAELTMKANGEAIWQHDKLADILAAEGGEESFEALVRAMDLTQSVLRARVIGAGQTFTRAGAPLTGLADLVTKFENELAAISSTPRTKLFGEAAGGLGSTGESQHGDWDETKATYRKDNQTPAYEWITALILRTLGGLPKRWKVEGRKYRQLNAKQQAELTKLDADTDIALAGAGIITADIVQQRAVWRDRYQLAATTPED
ncbi:MAG: anti-CBASS protein Acb1 family protein, partial [Alsobacter sp.]